MITSQKNNDLYAVNDSGYNPLETHQTGCPLSISDSTSPEASRQERQETLWANFFLQPRRLSSSTSLSAPSNAGRRAANSSQKKLVTLLEAEGVNWCQNTPKNSLNWCHYFLRAVQSDFGGVISRSWRAS